MISAQPLALQRLDPLLIRLRDRATHLAAATRARAAQGWRRIRGVRREHLLWAALIAVFVLYALVLILSPTGAGRGGR